jgi:uncharacterized membrane protein
MRERVNLDAIPFACGAILLGVVTLAVQDFALTWQPVPAGIPARAPLAIVSGLILIAGALACLWKGAGRAGLILPLFFALWVVALHVPNVIANPHLGSLLGVAEITSLAVGGFAATRWALKPPAATAVRLLYGLCPIVFGLSHFVYAQITASMVPTWLPGPLFWAYLTGAAHLAAGIAILTNVFARLAVTLLAIMCGLFVLLLHLPRVAAAPTNRLEWTMLGAALTIAGAAWLMRRSLAGSDASHGHASRET